MLSHQWRVKKTRPGPLSPQRGPQENAQTVYFKRFGTFFGVQIRGGGGRTHARTDARTHGRRVGTRHPSTTHAGKKYAVRGKAPPHSDIYIYI